MPSPPAPEGNDPERNGEPRVRVLEPPEMAGWEPVRRPRRALIPTAMVVTAVAAAFLLQILHGVCPVP